MDSGSIRACGHDIRHVTLKVLCSLGPTHSISDRPLAVTEPALYNLTVSAQWRKVNLRLHCLRPQQEKPQPPVSQPVSSGQSAWLRVTLSTADYNRGCLPSATPTVRFSRVSNQPHPIYLRIISRSRTEGCNLQGRRLIPVSACAQLHSYI